MDWELVLRPDEAARLTRLKLLAPLRDGRAASRSARIVWHDGSDAALARDGLALAERRGQWRLELMRPGSKKPASGQPGWPPGTPPPILAEAATLKQLSPGPASALPQPCIAWAAFEGRALTLALRLDNEGVELTLVQGVIRSVMREHPVCRVRLSGPAPQATALALLLAAELDLAVPRASLAEEALEVARGSTAQPRALGAPALPPDCTVAEAFDHIVGHLADVILYWAPLAAGARHGPEPVHQMRVAARRLRSAFSVFSSATACSSVAEADTGLKALTATLGPARDWDVFNAGIGAEIGAAFAADTADGNAVAKLLAATERQRLAGYDTLQRFLASPGYRQLGIRLAALASARLWETEIEDSARATLNLPLAQFGAELLAKRLKRMFADGVDIEHLETATLHKIRLRAKRLRYAAEFFATLFPPKPTRRFIRRLSDLQESLGTLNDGAVAADLLAALPGGGADRAFAIGAVRGFLAARGGASRGEIARKWKKFRKQEPFWS